MGGVGNAIGKVANTITGADTLAQSYGDASNAELGQQREDRSQALGYAVSDQELQQLQQNIALNNQDISRKQKLLASADPALIEAGNQALQLMQGKSAAGLKPLQNQRAQQRQQLQASLASQLGPDYATSSQGQNALNQFDQQSADQMNNAQQAAIGQYMGYAQNAEQFGNLNSNMQQSNNFVNQYGDQSRRRMGAITGNTINPGLQYSGQIFANQQAMQNTGKLIGAGASAFTGMPMGGVGQPSGISMAGGSDASAMGSAGMMAASKGGVVPGDRFMTLKDVTPKSKKKGK